MKFVLFVVGVIGMITPHFAYSNSSYKHVCKLMGVRFEFTVVFTSQAEADEVIQKGIEEVRRIEKLISSWDKNSQTSVVNQNAGISAVKVDDELFQLVERGIRLSKLTEGAFDLSYASMDRIWKFDGTQSMLPSPQEVSNSVSKVGFQKIILNKSAGTIYLTESGMKIGFGAIGKGYAANRVKSLFQSLGVESGVVNAGGDLITWGHDVGKSNWDIALANPDANEEVMAWLPSKNGAVVTSGNYEKFFEVNGERYSHIINPKTGYPVRGVRSVTIVCPDAELADGLSTSVFVLGVEKGIDLVNTLKGVECIIVDEENNLHRSNGMNIKSIN